MVKASYCTQCGTKLSGEGRFCPSCGSPINSDGGHEGGTEKPPGLASKVGAGLAAAIAIPLTLIMGLIGLVLPFLFIAALVWGPSETWDRIQAWIPGDGREAEAAGCEGFDDWSDQTTDRQNEMYALVEPVLKREVTDPAALRSISNDLSGHARSQERSDPPAEAVKLNEALVEMYDLMSEMTLAMANGDVASYSTLSEQYETALTVADEEDKRVRQACL